MIDTAASMALREADALATQAENSDRLEVVPDYGGRLKQTLEAIDGTAMDETSVHKIHEAIRHATNTEHAVNHNGGQHDAGKARELIAELLAGR
jgi:hypothetical protein